MFETVKYPKNRDDSYKLLIAQAKALIEDEPDLIANLSNISALLNDFFTEINWVGFYLLKKDQLVLGPFQGKVACTRIPIGKGVCGTAVKERKSQVIENVHEFSGHIACDCASNSEIVTCIYSNGNVVGVLDIDSYVFSRFDDHDRVALEELCGVLSALF